MALEGGFGSAERGLALGQSGVAFAGILFKFLSGGVNEGLGEGLGELDLAAAVRTYDGGVGQNRHSWIEPLELHVDCTGKLGSH